MYDRNNSGERRSSLKEELRSEVKMPLVALVSLAGSLADELTGEERKTALQVEDTGRELILRVDRLLQELRKGNSGS